MQIAQASRPMVKGLGMWGSVKALARGYDYLMGLVIFAPVAILAWFPFMYDFQSRLLFNQAFSRGLQIQRILAGGKKQKWEYIINGLAPITPKSKWIENIERGSRWSFWINAKMISLWRWDSKSTRISKVYSSKPPSLRSRIALISDVRKWGGHNSLDRLSNDIIHDKP